MNETTAIFAAAVLQEAGRLASSREGTNGPFNPGKVIGAQDIQIAIRTLETIIDEISKKGL